MNKFKKKFISFISCVLTVVILMSTSSTLIYATENMVSQSSEQSEAVNNDIKTEKSSSIDVIENNIKQDERKSNAESLNNKTNEAKKEYNEAEQANVNSTQEDFKIALKWGRSIRQYIHMECNKE